MVNGFDKVLRATDDFETTTVLSAPHGLELVYPDDPDLRSSRKVPDAARSLVSRPSNYNGDISSFTSGWKCNAF